MLKSLVVALSLSTTAVAAGEGVLSGVMQTADPAQLTANARRIVRGATVLPDTSFYIPNSFPNSSVSNYYGFLHGISRVRKSNLRAGCEPDCSDAIAYLEADVWKDHQQSFTAQLSVHSLSGRNGGTGIGEGASLGFKYARRIDNTSAVSFSGEHAIQLDNTVDLGRNLFLGYSKFVDRKKGRELGQGTLFNIGLGSGLYTVYDNSVLDLGNALGGNNISGDFDKLTWGVVGSVSYYHSSWLSVGAEFTGYGFGAGVSVKPFKNHPLTATGYLYDLINDFPQGIPCAESPCVPRLYGRLTYSF